MFRDNRGSTLERFDEQQYERLRSEASSALEKGRGIIRLVRDPSGQLHAGAFFVQSKDRLIFLFSGTSAEARKSGAMSALIDRVIHAHAGTNMRLDFEGSVDPNLARFYRKLRFGGSRIFTNPKESASRSRSGYSNPDPTYGPQPQPIELPHQ